MGKEEGTRTPNDLHLVASCGSSTAMESEQSSNEVTLNRSIDSGQRLALLLWMAHDSTRRGLGDEC